jgi:hypothetical protein
MLHPSIERLAALADESPTADEHAHLAGCADCAREVEAHRSLLAMATHEREAMGLPLTRWDTLASALRADGLIRTGSGAGRGSAGFSPTRMLQVAAALLLVATGALLGRASAGAPVIPGDGERGGVADVRMDSLPTSFASLEEATRLRNLYREGYQRAVTYLAANDTTVIGGTPAVMRARLSALDRVYRITSEALADAPFDPVLNDFYLNSFGQREATLREVNAVLPAGVRLNSY